MPTDIRYRRSFLSRLRFFLQFLGITGIFAAAVGFVLFHAENLTIDVPTLTEAGHNQLGLTPLISSYLIVAGLGLAALALLIEILASLGKSTGGKSLVGANALLQIVLAVAVLAAVNVYSFNFSKRWDVTKDKEFTLSPNVVEELKKLQGDTQIVVLQLKSIFGQLTREPDSYDNAAATVVVDKIRDLVDEFRRLGPRFQVSILDRKNDDFDRKLEELTSSNPSLKAAILSAPESSIFFAADGKIQRLGFNEFYQLDKAASRAANDKGGNLVLRPQGLMPFLNRITAVQERKPRIGLAVIHPILGSEKGRDSEDGYTASGLRKTLESYGFEVVDIILKKWGRRGPPGPAAFNFAETRLEIVENELEEVDGELREMDEERANAKKMQEIFEIKNIEEVKAILEKLSGSKRFRNLTEETRKRNLASVSEAIESIDKLVVEKREERQKLNEELNRALANEHAIEDRRVTDVKAKFGRMLGDCDLLILPRMTILDASSMDSNIPPDLYNLSKEQIEVIKDFMKAGKPVLALMGPINTTDEQLPPPDDFEKLLTDRGVELGKQTILFDADLKAFASQLAGEQFGGKQAEVPPVSFKVEDKSADKKSTKINPLGRAMQATSRGVDQALDIRLRVPRPIYLLPGYEDKQPILGEFITVNSPEAWNEEKPILAPTERDGRRVINKPSFKPTKFDDPKKDTHDEVRHGPFPVGVAVESKIPIEWVDSNYANYKALSGALGGTDQGILAACLTAASEQVKRPVERLVVIGQGGIFVKPELGPAKEQLLLHICNWLLGREDRLPAPDQTTWEYPRLPLTEKQKMLWHYGTFVGLPALFAYLGIVVLMIRKLR